MGSSAALDTPDDCHLHEKLRYLDLPSNMPGRDLLQIPSLRRSVRAIPNSRRRQHPIKLYPLISPNTPSTPSVPRLPRTMSHSTTSHCHRNASRHDKINGHRAWEVVAVLHELAGPDSLAFLGTRFVLLYYFPLIQNHFM